MACESGHRKPCFGLRTDFALVYGLYPFLVSFFSSFSFDVGSWLFYPVSRILFLNIVNHQRKRQRHASGELAESTAVATPGACTVFINNAYQGAYDVASEECPRLCTGCLAYSEHEGNSAGVTVDKGRHVMAEEIFLDEENDLKKRDGAEYADEAPEHGHAFRQLWWWHCAVAQPPRHPARPS